MPAETVNPVSPPHVTIIGGGLAGIAAAVALDAAGHHVTLLEARHALGGRATSFSDPDTDELLDNCQHVLLGCCTNLLDLYQRLGVQDRVAFHDAVHFLDAQGRRHTLRAQSFLPAPLHLGPAFARFSLLTMKERFAIARAMRAMLRLGRTERNDLDHLSFGQWLAPFAQPDSLFTKFYDPVLISALNEHSKDASAKYAIMVFQDAMLAHRRGYVVGLPTCPLSELYAHLPPGIDLRLNTRVEALQFSPALRRATALNLRSGETIPVETLILATSHQAVMRFIPEELRQGDPRFAHLSQLTSVPILGVHLWFDRPILNLPAVALTSGPLHWLFKKNAAGSAVHGVLSAARAWPAIPKDQALAQFTAQIQSLIPAARDAKLLRGLIVIEKRATFSPLPGTDALRPAQAPPAGGIANLYLAGDYTQTHWPATMEGAVRSGYLAAGALAGASLLLPDLPTEWPARLLGL